MKILLDYVIRCGKGGATWNKERYSTKRMETERQTFARLEVTRVVKGDSFFVFFKSLAPLQRYTSRGRLPGHQQSLVMGTISVVAELAVQARITLGVVIDILVFARAEVASPPPIIATNPHLLLVALLVREAIRNGDFLQIAEVLMNVHDILATLLHLLLGACPPLEPSCNSAFVSTRLARGIR